VVKLQTVAYRDAIWGGGSSGNDVLDEGPDPPQEGTLVGTARLVLAADESILCREGWRRVLFSNYFEPSSC